MSVTLQPYIGGHLPNELDIDLRSSMITFELTRVNKKSAVVKYHSSIVPKIQRSDIKLTLSAVLGCDQQRHPKP